MRKKIYIFLLILLVLSTDIVLGSARNKINNNKTLQNKHNFKDHAKASSASTSAGARAKRALDDGDGGGGRPLWPNRGNNKLDSEDDEQFWATRGRRDSSSVEDYVDLDKSSKLYNNMQNDRPCENCYPVGNSDAVYGNIKQTREDVSPFWGMRGRRTSEEIEDDENDGMFWGSRGRRQENEPFWGNRGRRQDDAPFWGNRGRREEEPFWGNRGRRQETPFWGHRGRRDNGEPFWGTRGRREDAEPFWGNRGRREDNEPFWGNRGRRKEAESFWSSRGRRKHDLKESIINAINAVEDDIESLSRLRRSDQSSFWSSRSRESKLQHLFNGPARPRPAAAAAAAGTLLDNRMYAEEPHYILVERNSRGGGNSAEEDPFFISRGKKYYFNYDFEKAARDRRGAIEEIVKSVRNDPFYIARGKKDFDSAKVGNTTLSSDEFLKARELICATIDLMMIKREHGKAKRELDAERERRTMLKKLAAQLQADPYFVSRGRRGGAPSPDALQDFINDVANKCN